MLRRTHMPYIYIEESKRKNEKFKWSKKHSENILYSDLLNKWLISAKNKVRESSYMRYKNIVEKHLIPELGAYYLYEINLTLIESYICFKLENGRIDRKGGLSPKTVSDIASVIKISIKYATSNNLQISVPINQLSVKKSSPEIRVLSISEQQNLTSFLLNDMNLIKMGVLISLYTGIRLGEICALKWENINLESRVIQIKASMQRIQNDNPNISGKTKVIVGEPKSLSSVRDIPIPDFLIEILNENKGSANDFVLTGKANSYVEPRMMQLHFKEYVNQSNLSGVNYHALRHTFATRCVEAGFDIKTLSEILGHSNVNTTLNRYVHTSFELKYRNMLKLRLIK